MIYLYLILFAYVMFYGTWIFYVGFMHIKEHRHQVQEKAGLLWYGLWPWFIFAYAMDIVFNLTVGSVLFFELPTQWTFSERIIRHQTSKGWRLRLANYFCHVYLKPFDEGHCK